jgi:hypothetical protein
MYVACSGIILLHGLLTELGFFHIHFTLPYDENINDIQIVVNPIYYEVDCHFIQVFDYKVITLLHIFTTQHITNIFTKSMTC